VPLPPHRPTNHGQAACTPHLLCGLHTLEYLRRYVYAVLLFKLNAASFIFNFLLPPPKYGNKKAERARIKFMLDEACVCVWAPILRSDAQKKFGERLKLRIIVECARRRRLRAENTREFHFLFVFLRHARMLAFLFI